MSTGTDPKGPCLKTRGSIYGDGLKRGAHAGRGWERPPWTDGVRCSRGSDTGPCAALHRPLLRPRGSCAPRGSQGLQLTPRSSPLAGGRPGSRAGAHLPGAAGWAPPRGDSAPQCPPASGPGGERGPRHGPGLSTPGRSGLWLCPCRSPANTLAVASAEAEPELTRVLEGPSGSC